MAVKENPTLTFYLDDNKTERVELRTSGGNDGNYDCALVHYDVDGNKTYYSLYNKTSLFIDRKADKNHASTETDYGLADLTKYGHTKLVNALTQSSYASGTALSAYQGYLLNNNLQAVISAFKEAICEGGKSTRFISVTLSEPSSESGGDRLNYLQNQFKSNSMFGNNVTYLIRYYDKKQHQYLAFGIKPYDGDGSRCILSIMDQYGNFYYATYYIHDGTNLSWRRHKLCSSSESPTYQIGNGKSVSFGYDNCCHVIAFRGSNYIEYVFDAWSSATKLRSSSSFSVTMSCSNNNVTIANNSGSSINVIITRGTTSVNV